MWIFHPLPRMMLVERVFFSFVNDSQLHRWAVTMGSRMGAGGIFPRWAAGRPWAAWAVLITSPLRPEVIKRPFAVPSAQCPSFADPVLSNGRWAGREEVISFAQRPLSLVTSLVLSHEQKSPSHASTPRISHRHFFSTTTTRL